MTRSRPRRAEIPRVGAGNGPRARPGRPGGLWAQVHGPGDRWRRRKPIEARLLALVEPEPMSGCWLWLGAVSTSGYGLFYVGGSEYAHRVAYALWKGDPASNMILHRCDVQLCVNPLHLYKGDALENSLDCSRKGRRRTKLTPQAVDAIKALHADGLPVAVLATTFKVSRVTVHAVLAGRIWKHAAPRGYLTAEQVDAIRFLWGDGLRPSKLAVLFGVSLRGVRLILRGQSRRRPKVTRSKSGKPR